LKTLDEKCKDLVDLGEWFETIETNEDDERMVSDFTEMRYAIDIAFGQVYGLCVITEKGNRTIDNAHLLLSVYLELM
jgi:hypothetical protein